MPRPVRWTHLSRWLRQFNLARSPGDQPDQWRDSPARILLRHILPNAVTPAIVYLMTDMSLGILLGASLGYLGLGAQPPTPEWGVMVADGKNFMATAWWISTFPGLALTLAGVTFSLIGDGLADALRPRS